jgi:catechol 2,3-dioxygenase-like lactoylglutathione lyase family enzyme
LLCKFRVDQLDHVELFVSDRYEAAVWYERTLGLSIAPEHEHWAAHPAGPLMLTTAEAGTKLALFVGEPQRDRPTAGFHLVAFRVSRAGFDAFLAHVRDNPVFGEGGEEVRELAVHDHGAARSVYFRDPYGHRLEVTTYDVAPANFPGRQERRA